MASKLRGAGGGGGSSSEQRQPIEAPDSLRSVAYARIVDLISEGEIVGFSDSIHPMTCVYLNETPVGNADGTFNFKNLQIDSRVGTQTQEPLPNFDGVENEIGVAVELRQDTPWTRTITNLNVDTLRVRLSTPAMTSTNTSTGDISGVTVAYNFELSVDGGPFVSIFSAAFTGKTTTKYERSHRIELPPANVSWTLRVNRTTPDSVSAAVQSSTYVDSYTEIIEAKLRMPMSALVSVIIDAEQFNNIPTRAYDMMGRIIKVPSNYNPTTRVYTGVWDGTFQNLYSNNPAWVFYDMALNRRYGLGRRIPEWLVDKWQLYKIAQFCDESVLDGKGGYEPRFTCNLFIQSAEHAYKVMQDLATVFRGAIYSNGGAITPIGDVPEDPVYTYTAANVIDGKFSYTGSSRKVRHTVALVSWNDMSDFGRVKISYVEDSDGIARYGIQPTETIAVGCTSEGQARRLGRYVLATERLETNGVSFAVGMDGTVVAPGKIINIADPLRAGRRTGGRVSAATINTIVVDQLPVVAGGDTLIVTLPSAITEKRTVLSVAGNTITVTANFSFVPLTHSVWAVESPVLKMQTFRVLSVEESSDVPGYSISAMQHVPDKIAFVETGVQISNPPISVLGAKVLPVPTGIAVSQHDVATDNETRIVVNVDWLDVVGAVAYEVSWRVNRGSWVTSTKLSATNIELHNILPGVLYVQVVAMNAIGIRSQPGNATPFTVIPNSNAPGFLSGLTADINTALTTAQNAQATADGAVISFWQPTAPVIGSGAGEASVGDIWFDTDDGNHIWRLVGVAWVDAQDDQLAQALLAASTAQATADGKVKTFFQATAPVASGVGDLWVETDNGNHLWWWSGTVWDDSTNFSPLRVVSSVAGVLTLNCAFDEQFIFTLTENTTVQFVNVRPETTLIIEIRQTGNFTITWPSTVLPVSNLPYVVTIDGTALNPKIDTVGLHTDNGGITWHLRVDQQDTPAAGGSGGSFTATITPNPAYGYAASNPSLQVGVTPSGHTGGVTYAWTKATGGSGDWNGSTGDVGGAAFTCSNPAIANPTFSRTGSSYGYVAQNWRMVATDSSVPQKTVQTILEIALEDDGAYAGGSGGWHCVLCDAFVMDGRRARDVAVGSMLMGIDPITLLRKSLEVSYSETKVVDCVRIEFADGTSLSCSARAPIPTPDGLVDAQHMLGVAGITDAGSVEWQMCTAVTWLGEQEVQHITCEDGVFFAGDVNGRYVGHHNLKNIDPDAY